MLQQILKDMFIDPELLEELSEEQKQILFFKMREEQIRRWTVEEKKLTEEEKLKPRPKKKSAKNVRFYCDDEDKVIVDIITDEVDVTDFKKKQEEAALKRAEEQARKEAEEKRKKELEEIEARRKAEEKKLKEEEERLKKERQQKEAELRRQEEEEAVRLKSIKEAQLQKEKAKQEKREREERIRKERLEMERKRLEEAELRRKKMEEIRLREEAEKKKQEQALLEQEAKRKKELYEKMKMEQDEKRKKEEEEAKTMEEEWQEREKKAKEAEEQRRSSFSQTRSEMQRIRKLSMERAALNQFRMSNKPLDEKPEKEKARNVVSVALNNAPSSTFAGTYSKRGHMPPKRPPLPLRPTISVPVNVSTTQARTPTMPVKRDIVKPNRPPPMPNRPSTPQSVVDGKPKRPPRPKNRSEVATWWKEVEYDKCSGLLENKTPQEWFHGIISRIQAEKLLESEKKGTFIVRVSERVWGYTVSFKDVGRCKHFLIDTTSSGYQFFGTEQRIHDSLNELIIYHQSNPISVLGQEILRFPRGQVEGQKADYAELFEECTAI
ncbi:SH2 domain-containing protein 4B-like [Hydractinia symbiolongicarpus]|uniref:SH2 domain-containing protein 4B-like n=1 Tax=Hydractinia symbiolongicarpus TaxID=13093 RepID=UPI00254DCAB0|nr:SH2 domain-containing protein 4B-like [Hydractinia symbiolongicarpus]